MSRLWIVMCVLLAAPVLGNDEKPAESKTVSFADTPAENADAPAVAANAAGRRKLSDREARRFGLTFMGVRSALKELKAAGAIDGSESDSELSVIVVDHIAAKKENKAAYSATGAGAPDWDALLAFAAQIIALIMKIFAI